MDIKKLNPWNWFKHEEANAQSQMSLPAKQSDNVATMPGQEMLRLHHEINRLFDNLWHNFLPSRDSWYKPLYQANLNVASSEQQYTVTLEAAGLDEKDLELELKDNILLIRGKKEQSQEEKQQNYYRVERRYGSFERVLTIPEDADTQNIVANMKNGLLTIQIPRQPSTRKEVKRITINHS